MELSELETKLEEWTDKVLTSYQQGTGADTYQMMLYVDKIIAEAFDHSPIMEENE